MASNNQLNTMAQFPNIDQLSKNERGMFIKEHEFEASFKTMISELNSLLDASSSDSAIKNTSEKVQAELNILTGRIESEIVSLVKRYIEQIEEEEDQVNAAFERLYSYIYNEIQSINVNIQNRTTTYDIVMSYKLRLLNEVDRLFGKTSPYQDGRSSSENYSIRSSNSIIRLRDVDEGQVWKSFPVIIDPNITQDKIIKICEFTPIENGTSVPTFLAEILISGDLYAFKGLLKSTIQNRDGRFNETENRTAIFEADYFINQDLPFSIKTLYDSNRNKIAIALKYDDTEDKFTSIIKLDFSINLLVGSNLEFANKNTCVIMDGVDLNWYSVSINVGNNYIRKVTSHNDKITHGGAISLYLEAGKFFDFDLIFSNELRLDLPTGNYIDYSNINYIKTGNTEIMVNSVSIDNSGSSSTIIINDASNYVSDTSKNVQISLSLNSWYSLTDRNDGTFIKTTTHYDLPDLSINPELVSILIDGNVVNKNTYDVDTITGLMIINNITGNLEATVSAHVYEETEIVNSSN